MAPTKNSDEGNSASDTGAEFEENTAPHKVIVNTRPRVAKPEEDKPQKLTAKSTTVKPDLTKEEVAKQASDDDRQLVDELAEVAVEKQDNKDNPVDVTQQNVQALVDNKTYFVPIGQATKRRNTKIVGLLVAMAVVAVGIGIYKAL